MKVLWVDTETTGLEPENSGAFEIAMLGWSNGKCFAERDFRLNPLSETILYHRQSGAVHGITEDEIRSYAGAAEIVPVVASLLQEWKDSVEPAGEKMVIAGYNCKFDRDHLAALLRRYGYDAGDYFSGKTVDVFELVRKGIASNIIAYPGNMKLGSMCKSLGVRLDRAHNALADIRATRELAVKLFCMGVRN